ncbi:glycine betaine ABC transporter substrate-binding protein [uncultured Megasphaera sp.]|uniref:ABC transporter permease/substrate-binding protein n=1 Tax=uncultured Megasphaera sp. TaxID=165188 RepID=UPI002657DC42|nr:glycine betaine ABC transporter substrate-binding protein [uncultured Megasphaera sp.]
MTSFFALLLAKYPDVWMRFMEHMNMTTMAVFLSILIGVPLGIAVTKNKSAANIVIGIANLMQSIPCIALLAFSVPFVGIGEKPAIIMVIVYALLPIIKNTYTGIMSIDPHTMEAADGIGLSPWQQLMKVELPLAMPFIMAGIRISAVAAVGTMTIAAFAGAGGLGWFINMGLIGLNIDMVLLGAIPASILALLIDYLLSQAESLLVPEGLKPAAEITNDSQSNHTFKKVVVSALCLALVAVPLVNKGYTYYQTASQKKIVLGTSNFTEVFILGYMYEDLIEHYTDIKVERRFNLNGADFCYSALKNGDIDTFCEYTGTALMNFAKLPMDSNPDKVYQEVHDTLKQNDNVVVSKPFGFNNTYVLSVRPEFAQQHNLTKMSDLLAIANDVTLGCTAEFLQREDCLPGLEKKYGVHFKDAKAMDATIRYQAVANGEVDVVDAFSTDALLKKMQLKELPDDMQFFPPFYAVSFTRADVFEKYPELKDVFAKLDGQITDEEMRNMNYAVDIDGQDPHEVAHAFLVKKGLLPQ